MLGRPWAWVIPEMADHLNMPQAPANCLLETVQSVWGDSKNVKGLRALDLACGGGRNALYLGALGFEVDAVDLVKPDCANWPENVHFRQLDLETDTWPIEFEAYDLVVVTNYLHRPHFAHLLGALRPQGAVLVYETFMQGNARYGSPKNPDFLLAPGELLQRVSGLQVMRFEQGLRTAPTPAMIQRVVAISGAWSEIQSETKILNRRD